MSWLCPCNTEVSDKVGQYQNCLGTVYESSHIASFGFKPKPSAPNPTPCHREPIAVSHALAQVPGQQAILPPRNTTSRPPAYFFEM